MTDAIKYLKLLIVQLESVPVLLGYSRFKEALWTRAVNFLLASSRPETEPCVHSVVLQRGFVFFPPCCSESQRVAGEIELLMYGQMAVNHLPVRSTNMSAVNFPN